MKNLPQAKMEIHKFINKNFQHEYKSFLVKISMAKGCQLWLSATLRWAKASIGLSPMAWLNWLGLAWLTVLSQARHITIGKAMCMINSCSRLTSDHIWGTLLIVGTGFHIATPSCLLTWMPPLDLIGQLHGAGNVYVCTGPHIHNSKMKESCWFFPRQCWQHLWSQISCYVLHPIPTTWTFVKPLILFHPEWLINYIELVS